MLVHKFIDLLEAGNLLDPKMIEELRLDVSQSSNGMTIETLAQRLVDNEQLTQSQATQLVRRMNRESTSSSNQDEFDAPVVSEYSDQDDAIVASVDEADDADEPLVLVQPMSTVESVDDDSELDEAPAKNVSVAPIAPVSQYTTQSSSFRSNNPPVIKRAARIAAATDTVKPSRWETFRTVGAFGILLAVVIAFGFLVAWFLKGSADEQWAAAQASYENRDYKKAIQQFEQFIGNHKSHKNVSLGRCWIAIAKIRDETENSGDPFKATKVAEEVLPMTMKESGITPPVLADLAGALVNIGQKMVTKAEAAKTNIERKQFVDGLAQQLTIINNPLYIASQERRQNEPKINALEESRQRLTRDIQREDERTETLATMKSALEKSDAVTAYNARQTLVRRHPQLQSDPDLANLLVNATEIVKGSVKAATTQPEIAEQATTAVGKRVLLTSNSGTAIPLNENRMVFVRAKNGLYGIDGATGKVKWRKFVPGRDQAEVVYLKDNAVQADAYADCLLVEPTAGKLSRIASGNGDVLWSLTFNAGLLDPFVDRDLIYVSDRSGRVSCIDAESGAVRWAQQLPQPISAGTSTGNLRVSLFVVGGNSNIYSLSKRNGECTSVYYLGHEPDTISVAPVALLGRLIVFENAGPGFSQIRVLGFGDDESTLTNTQDPIRLKGHVVVRPEVEGRRMVVATNLGEISVFEVETVNGKSELVKMASLVASELRPKVSWPLISGNDLLVSGTQLTKYQIQASRQQLIREWVREDEDLFLCRPINLEDSVVHVRNVRGTQGVRIAAISKVKGDPVWETNVGVPVVSILQSGQSFQAITSQAALYTINRENLASGQIDGATLNPGRNQRQLIFDRVASSGPGSFVAVNSERGSQIAYYDSNASPDRKLVINSSTGGDAKPSGDPVALEGAIAVPLDNGQLIAVNPATGATIGSPIQPKMGPGEKISWATPCLADDGKTLFAANSKKVLIQIMTGKQFETFGTSVDTANPVTGRLASIGTILFTPTTGEQSAIVEVYNTGDLSRKWTIAIQGSLIWGLYRVGDMVLGYSNIEGLVAIDAVGERKWTAAVPSIVPIGQPQIIDGQIEIVTTTGEIFRLEPSDGTVSGVLKTGEPISSNPLHVGNNMLVPCDEGNVLIISAPQFQPYTNAPAE